ncbi:MAG TPA: Holliday junction resolvase RuvX [Thermoanaerobaculia bacterium]|jgi:putative Holliday junction resolvase|nr:Holliday junction resolvase RuvX [Thermoanaerobaculia bacterium]
MPAMPAETASTRRLLAVDFGEKRIGLAVSEGTLALPLATLRRTSDSAAVAAIAELAREQRVAALVVGEPRRLDGSVGDAARRARAFARKLAGATSLPCTLVDEALTSRAAEQRLREAGIDPRRHPERVDQVAAQILLEEALRREASPGAPPDPQAAHREEGGE